MSRARARIAFRHTPTDEELMPILPTIPGLKEKEG